MIRDLLDHLPMEGCGLLSGEPDTRLVTSWSPCQNIHADPAHHFTIDPADQRRVVESCRVLGWSILAVVHSHPTTPAVPSGNDRARPTPEGWDSVIVSLAGQPDRASLRAWVVHPDTVVEGLIIPG